MSSQTQVDQGHAALDENWEADPEGYTPLHFPLPTFDLSGILTGHEDAVLELRAKCIPYLHMDFIVAPATKRCVHTVFSQGGPGLIVLVDTQSAVTSSRGNVSFKVTKHWAAGPRPHHPDDVPTLSALFGRGFSPMLNCTLGLATSISSRLTG